jgi:hypothetical protein
MQKITHYGQYGPMASIKSMNTGLSVKTWYSVWSPTTPQSKSCDVSLAGTFENETSSVDVKLVAITEDRYLYVGRYVMRQARMTMLPVLPFSRVTAVILHISVRRKDTGEEVLHRKVPLRSPDLDEGSVKMGTADIRRHTGFIVIKNLKVKFPFSLLCNNAPTPTARRILKVVPITNETVEKIKVAKK